MFLQSSVKNHTKLAVCADQYGVSIAQVFRQATAFPNIQLCTSQFTENLSTQPAEILRLVKQHHLDRYTCVSVMDIGEYHLLLIDAPDVHPDELRRAVRWRVKDLIDFHIDDAVIDVFALPEQANASNNKMMYVVVASAASVKQRIAGLVEAGLKLDVIDIPELALRNIAALLPEDAKGLALVYIGRNGGLITIIRQSTLYLSRRISVGLDALSNATDEDAKQVVLDQIVVEVQRSIDYYESHFSQQPLETVVMAPMVTNVQVMSAYLAGHIDLRVYSLDINKFVNTPEPIPADIQSSCLLSIGAALRQEAVAL